MSVLAGRVGGGQLAARALVAGLIGGVLIDLFLFVFGFAPFPDTYQLIASGLVGKAAYTSSSYIWLGVAMHFAIAVVWAEIYAFVAYAANALHRWLVGGLVFGIVVMAAMDIVQVLAGLMPLPNAIDVVVGLVANVVFFGWPIAWLLRDA
jgi:hypothetical protein